MAAKEADRDDGRFMRQQVSVGYVLKPSPPQAEFARGLARRKIIGHRCPVCSKVYVPPKGYCPLCVVATDGRQHGVEVAAKGTVTSFTVVTPIQYPGQEEKAVYVVATVLLDGADTTMANQRIAELPPEEVRNGLRVEAEWSEDPKAEAPIAHFGPSGEPDEPLEKIQGHML